MGDTTPEDSETVRLLPANASRFPSADERVGAAEAHLRDDPSQGYSVVIPMPGPGMNDALRLACFANEPPPNATRRTGWVNFVIFALFLYIVLSVVLAFTVQSSSASYAYVLESVLSLAPTAVLTFVFYWRKHKTDASLGLFSKLFALGMLGAIPAAVVELLVELVFGLALIAMLRGAGVSNIQQGGLLFVIITIIVALASAYLVAAGVEESLKYFVADRMTHQSTPVLWHPRACLIYGLAAGLGFATIENALYVFGEHTEVKEAAAAGMDPTVFMLMTAVFRGLFAVPMHACCGMLIGHGFARRFYDGENLSMWGVIRPAFLLHGTYDAVLMLAAPFGVAGAVTGLLLAVLLVFWGYWYLAKRVLPQSVDNRPPHPTATLRIPATVVPVPQTRLVPAASAPRATQLAPAGTYVVMPGTAPVVGVPVDLPRGVANV